MALASKGRNGRLLYKVKSSRASDGSVVYSCIFSCLDDVEHHRHRRNPFDPKYIQAALSSFDELGRDNFDRVVTREEVEAASTSVHVRMELIKSMKDGLVKLTNEAVKHCKVTAKKAPKHKSSLEENKACGSAEAITLQQKTQSCNFFDDDSIDVYQRKFGQSFEALQVMRHTPGSLSRHNDSSTIMGSINLELAQTMNDLDYCLNGNASFLPEDELCFNINKETMEVLHDVLQRTQAGFQSAVYCEDGFADLSPFKRFISPITKDLILDLETSQDPGEKNEETTSQHDEVELRSPTNGCLKEDSQISYEVFDGGSLTTSTISEHTAFTNLQQVESAVPLEKSLNDSKVMHSLEAKNLRGVSAISSEPDDISSPLEYHEDLMDIASADEMMEDISHEEVEDDIEDGEVPYEANVHVQLCPQDEDIEDGEVLHGANVSVQICLQSEDIEKFLDLRKQIKKNKSSWLVHDPEKLLLPANTKPDIEPKHEDVESMVENFVLDGRIFRQALSRVGVDLIVHFNLLQEDPSKVPGAFHFKSLATNFDDLQSTYSCSLLQEPGSHHQSLERSLHKNKESSLKGENCWDNIAWATVRAPASSISKCMLSAECGDMPRPQMDSPLLEETDAIFMGEKSQFSSMLQDYALQIGVESSDKFSLSSVTGLGSKCMESAKKKENGDWFLQHSANLAAEGDRSLPDSMGAQVHEAFKKGETTKFLQIECPSSNSIPSSGVVNEDNVPMTTANQDDAVSQIEMQQKAVLEDANLSFGSYQVASQQQTPPWGDSGLVRNSQNQAHQGERKRFHLNELITGAVIAECQLHQKSFSHFDLEPLSRLLATHMMSIFQKQNTKSIVLKDLIAACNWGQSITLQRYVVALLSVAHQQNMGRWKDSRTEGHQIMLRAGVSGKISDIEISLLLPTEFL